MKGPATVLDKFSTQWKKMIESAEKEGIIFVTSAGNHVGTVGNSYEAVRFLWTDHLTGWRYY